MFKLERKLNTEEFSHLQMALKRILHKKVNDDNVLDWVDTILSSETGHISFGNNCWVGVTLDYCTVVDICKRFNHSNIIKPMIEAYTTEPCYWIITHYHRYISCYKLGELDLLVYGNYDTYAKSLFGKAYTAKVKEDLRLAQVLKAKKTEEIIQKYVQQG